MNTLFLYGAPDDNHAFINISACGEAGLIIIGADGLSPMLNDLPGQSRAFCLSGQQGHQDLQLDIQPDVIINQIHEPDSHETALVRGNVLCEQLNLPVVNAPKHILLSRRDHLFIRLQDIQGLRIPTTFRIKPKSPADIEYAINKGGINYPVIIRPAGHPFNCITKVLQQHDDLESETWCYALDGSPYYLTRLIDYASKDGLYRKFRLVVIEGRAYLRNYTVSDEIFIHKNPRSYMELKRTLLTEEQRIFENFDSSIWPRIADTIHHVAEELQLDYFTLDCNINTQGELLLFEISADMDFLTRHEDEPECVEEPIRLIRSHLIDMIQRKIKPELR